MKTKFFDFIITVLLLLAVSGCNSPHKGKSEEKDAFKSIFSTPFSNLRITGSEYLINPAKDTILTYISGSKILIPKNAFVDSTGNTVSGEVRLTYREFSNPVDLFLAGIPMAYDSAGVDHIFVTAGMLEINAFKGELTLYPDPKNRIRVEMTSFDADPGFNLYSLDTLNGKWKYIGKDRVVSTTYADASERIPRVPEPPKKAGPYSFTIHDGTGLRPELNIYKNVRFEPADGKRHGFPPTDIRVSDLKNGKYRVKFILLNGHGIERMDSCDCYLSFKEGEDYDNALTAYRSKYRKEISRRDRVRRDVEDEWDKYYEACKKYRVFFFKREISSLTGLKKISRTFEISGFGFINCDKPSSFPSGAELTPVFKDLAGDTLHLNNVVLAEYGKNALFRFNGNIKFNPDEKNVLWGMTDDNRLAFFNADDFKKINCYKGEYTFVMRICSDTLKTYDDICRVLF